MTKERDEMKAERNHFAKEIKKVEAERNNLAKIIKEMKVKADKVGLNFKEIKDGDTVLIIVPQAKVAKINTEILKYYITKLGYNAVYITVNKPFSALIDNFKRNKINTNKLFIIDAVTPVSALTPRLENAVFAGSPSELTNISITTTSVIEKLGTAKILMLDSISTLFNYNDFKASINFIHFITNKMKSWKITFAMVCAKEMTDENALAHLKSFCDEVIEVK